MDTMHAANLMQLLSDLFPVVAALAVLALYLARKMV